MNQDDLLSAMTMDEIPCESPLVETIWRSRSSNSFPFTSQAVSHGELVFYQDEGNPQVTIRGPETRSTSAMTEADAEYFGIQFKLGTFIPHLPTVERVDSEVVLPEASSQKFWLNGSAWQFPTFEYADVFIARLEREGLLVRDPVVTAVLAGREVDVSPKTVRRRFVQATGLAPKTVQQIERAKQAGLMIQNGLPLADVVHLSGYADHPHLSRALKHFLGLTPTQILGKAHDPSCPFYSRQPPQFSLPCTCQLPQEDFL